MVIDSATPVEDRSTNIAGPSYVNPAEAAAAYGGYGGPMRAAYGRMYGSLDFDDVSRNIIYISNHSFVEVLIVT